jgi:quercetin dioxygenase-like cupin family protein
MTINGKFNKAASAVIFLATASILGASAAYADECPAGKTGMDVTKPGPMSPVGVTDNVIASIDLKGYGSAGHQLRMRRLVVQPGGIVPWHSHAQRPANILVVSGSITEYRSTCGTPINHPEGDVTAESGNLSHWWKNNTNKPAVLISADVLPPAKSADGMM